MIAREHVQGKPQPDDGNDLGMVQQLDTHDELATLYAKTFLVAAQELVRIRSRVQSVVPDTERVVFNEVELTHFKELEAG